MRLQLIDSQKYQNILRSHFPGIQITGTPLTSGQRLVYFATFDDFLRNEPEGEKLMTWSNWGNTVVKLSDANDESWASRSAQEIEILNSLNSPCFPQFYRHEVLSHDPETEFNLHPKLLVTIEEYIDGQPLSELLDYYSNERTIKNLLYKLITGLRVLWEHKQQYVHRDIKPENILIKPSGDVVIIDLGISRETGQSGVTVTAASFGPCTPEFASPEQAKNDKKNINYKSDIFSVGALAYFLVSKEYPFGDRKSGSGLMEVLDNVVSHHPTELHKLRPDISVQFSKTIEKMIAKKPYQRFRQVDKLLLQLEEKSDF